MGTEHLSPREREIMDVLLVSGEATAGEVQTKLKDPLANATVRTILRILEEKGEVKHRLDGRRFVYRPARSRQQLSRSAVKRMVDVFFKGSVTDTVHGLLQWSDTKLTDAEWEELAAMVEKGRHRKQRRKRS